MLYGFGGDASGGYGSGGEADGEVSEFGGFFCIREARGERIIFFIFGKMQKRIWFKPVRNGCENWS